MPRPSYLLSGEPLASRVLVLMAGAAALTAGLYGRFKGIGIWPLGVDEYYISRSIDNVLRTGLPRFSCGGYYTRGILFQYVVAGMRLGGLQPEVAGRLLAGLCSVMVLPPAYALAKRIEGSLAGWVTVIILCVSVWEIEMARFARMYAPFQAVFTWYLVFYLRATVDRNGRAVLWLIGLSVLGVLTWEGGVLLGVANVLAVVGRHEAGRLRRADVWRLAGMLVLLALLFLATRDLRGFAEAPTADTATLGAAAATDAGAAAGPVEINDSQGYLPRWAGEWLTPLLRHPVWAGGLLLPVGLALASLPWIWSQRRRWWSAAGLCAALAAAVAHVFTVTFGVLAMMVFMKLIERRDYAARGARYFAFALAGLILFWLAFDHWVVHPGAASAQLIHDSFGFPDVYNQMVRPWGRTFPVLLVATSLALGFWSWRAAAGDDGEPDPVARLLSVLVLMMLAVGATAAERSETRYTFFLYPLLIVLAVAALSRLLRRWPMARRMPVLLVAAPLACFGATEDFQPEHIAHVDSAAVNFRVGMSAARAAHYYPRNDMRSVGRWLAGHAQRGDIVITGIPNLEQYYGDFTYFFLDDDDPRYEAYVCQNGSTERWTDHAVLYGEQALKSILTPGGRVFASVYPDTEQRLLAAGQSQGWSVTRVWSATDGQADVVLIAATQGSRLQ